jgi:large subunit ribosomal protein L4
MRRQSLVSVLSDKVREGELVVVEELTLERPTTREMVRVMGALGVGPSVLLVADGAEPSVLRSARNIPRLDMEPAALLNTLDLLNHGNVVMTMDAVRKAEELWGGSADRRRKGPASPVAEA